MVYGLNILIVLINYELSNSLYYDNQIVQTQTLKCLCRIPLLQVTVSLLEQTCSQGSLTIEENSDLLGMQISEGVFLLLA